MRKIDINECHTILIDMAKIVNDICERHGITFYMLGGTMLGAIRHKGFIPWDDDMDFGVMYDDYLRLIDILEAELPNHYRVLTYEKDKKFLSFFMKVEDKRTVAMLTSIDEPIEKQYGITLDIFPLIKCVEEDFETLVPKIHKIYMTKRRIYVGTITKKWYKVFTKRILRAIYPISSQGLNRKTKTLVDQMVPGNYVCNVASPQFWNKHFTWEMFKQVNKYQFEDSEFWGVSDYDAYLSMLYKNYMKLPPAEKQIIHLDNVWWR